MEFKVTVEDKEKKIILSEPKRKDHRAYIRMAETAMPKNLEKNPEKLAEFYEFQDDMIIRLSNKTITKDELEEMDMVDVNMLSEWLRNRFTLVGDVQKKS